MKALVLSGGGSRGAYECGAWEALRKMNIRFDGVYGTSIGAVNAALVAQGDLDMAIDLWSNITMNHIAARDDGEEINITHMLTRKRDMIPFLVGNAKNLRLDITPFEKLLNEKINEGKVRSSGLKFGVMLTDVNKPHERPVRLDDIPQGQLTQYLLASAACFPVFPIRKIDEHKYIDGGFVDNMPVGMAIEDGAEEIIAVDIHPQPVHPEYEVMPFLRLIHPMRELCNFLDFDRAALDRARRLGYNDTMKSYGVYDGIRYSFIRVSDLETSAPAHRYLNTIALFDARAHEKKEEKTLISMLTAEAPGRQLSWKDSLLRGLELCADLLEFREEGLYRPHDLTKLVLEHVNGMSIDGMAIKDIEKMPPHVRMAMILRGARESDDFIREHIKKLADYPKEMAAALYLLTMERA